VDEVGGAVQGIDDPDVVGVLVAVFAAGFFGQDAVLGVGVEQGLDDDALGRLVHLGHKVVDLLLRNAHDSTSSAARLMMAPAARAALMATLSMGCRLVDIDCEALGKPRRAHAVPTQLLSDNNRMTHRPQRMKNSFRRSDPVQWQCNDRVPALCARPAMRTATIGARF
jgi:hypothetical protein